MALFIDSADRSLIEEVWTTGVFEGVTTNPTILARAGLAPKDVPALYRWLGDLGVRRIFVQVNGRTTKEMLASADAIRGLGAVTVKVPATADGFAACRVLLEDGAQVLLTAVYHPVQALMARDMGIQGIAPYVGRMTDAGRAGVPAVVQMQQAIGHSPTRILAASLRSPEDVATLAAAGVPDFTLGAALVDQVLNDPLTAAAVDEIERAAEG
jgi:transaldolase